MSGVRSNPRPGTLRLIAVMAVGLSCTALAQPPVLVPPETTVYLVLRTGPKLTEKDILAAIKEGIDKSGATISGEPTIRTVSPAFLEEFESLVDRATVGPVVAAKDGVSIRLLPSRDQIFEVKLAPTQILKKLKVTYEKAGEKEYVPAAPGVKSSLVLTVPGRYAFTPEPNDVPTAYVGDVAELGKSDSPIKGDWPKSDKCFIVTMRNFRGDRKLLFDTIQDGKLVANPLKNVRLGNDLLFAFASLNSDAAKRDPATIDADGRLTITIPTLPERNPRRVWVYFPLTADQMDKERKRFQKFEGADMPAEIRKEAAGDNAKIGPTDLPRWFEVPPGDVNRTTFTRKVQLENLPGLAKAYPQVWWLVVWEFDNGGARSAIKVVDGKGNAVFVLEEELARWQEELQKAPAAKPKDVPKP